MNRLFTLITPNGIDKKNEIYSLFIAVGAQVIRKKYYKNAPTELISKLLESLANMKEDSSQVIKILKDVYIEKPIEVAVWEVQNDSIDKLQKKYLEYHQIDHILDINLDSLCVFTITDIEANEFGSIFFWQECYDTTKFVTDNEDLFKYVYLPVQLAKDGKGIFFEERIENRLIEIGFIRKSDEIITIIDRGGWENLQNLTARMDVDIKREKNIITETLLVAALVPMPPVKPGNLSKVIQQRKSFLNLLEIPTSVLEASEGLVYERSIPYPIGKYIANPQNKNIKKIVRETALIAAILDSDCFNIANIKIKIDGFNGITDLVEISNYSSIDNEFHFNFIDVLKTDGNSVFWTNLYRNLAEYGPKKSQLNIEKLLSVCHSDLHNYALQAYHKIKEECLNGNWLSRKLFNK